MGQVKFKKMKSKVKIINEDHKKGLTVWSIPKKTTSKVAIPPNPPNEELEEEYEEWIDVDYLEKRKSAYQRRKEEEMEWWDGKRDSIIVDLIGKTALIESSCSICVKEIVIIQCK